MSSPTLLAVIEVGGYPNFTPLYQSLGFTVECVPSVRKAQAWLKKNEPQVVMAEFNFDPEFRDRMSHLESLLASLQRYCTDTKVIVFIEEKHLPRLSKVLTRYSIFHSLVFPIKEAELERLLQPLAAKPEV